MRVNVLSDSLQIRRLSAAGLFESILCAPHRVSVPVPVFWRLTSPCLSRQSNNDVVFPPMALLPAKAITLSPRITLNNDSAESVQREALRVFKTTTFTSYIELRPLDAAVLLVLRGRNKTGKKDERSEAQLGVVSNSR